MCSQNQQVHPDRNPPSPLLDRRMRRLIPLGGAALFAMTLVLLLVGTWQRADASRLVAETAALAIRYVSPGHADAGDTGTCQTTSFPCKTIQYAISVAADGDTIQVVGGTYGTINTQGGLRQVLYVDKSVTIVGGYDTGFVGTSPGNPTNIVPATPGRGVVVIGTVDVTLRNLTIRNGNGAAPGLDGNGGGLFVQQANVTLNTVTLQNNSGTKGAGIYVDGGALTAASTTVQNNTATADGGGLYVQSSTTQGQASFDSGSSFSQNTAVRGGGVFVASGAALLNGAALAQNSATGGTDAAGGGGYASGGSLHIANSSNLASNSAAGGTGSLLYIASATGYITGGTVSGYTGANSAIYLSGSTLHVAGNASFTGNASIDKGGVIQAYTSTVRLANATASNNTAKFGGFLYGEGTTVLLANSTVSQNSATAGSGGGLAVLAGAVALDSSTISQNSAPVGDGGGLYVVTGTATLTRTDFSQNTAHNNGGGLFGQAGALLRVSGGTLSANVTISGSGGAIFWDGAGVEITDAAILSANKAGSFTRGGGRAADALAHPVAVRTPWDSTGPQVIELRASGRGMVLPDGRSSRDMTGLIQLARGWRGQPLPETGHPPELTVTGPKVGEFAARSAAATVLITQVITRSGGGLYAQNANVTVTGATLRQNRAGYSGGGLLVAGGSLAVTNGTVAENVAERGSGGGVAGLETAGVISKTNFTKNQAINGAAAYVTGNQLTFSQNTAQENTAREDGGGLYARSAKSSISSNTLAKNTSDRGGGLYLSGGETVISQNEISENTTSFRRTVLFNQPVGIGAGVYLSGTTSFSFTNNLVTRNTIPYRLEDVVVGQITETVTIPGTDPPTVLQPGVLTERRILADNGAGLFVKGGAGTIAQNNFKANDASLHGAAMYVEDAKLDVLNNLMVRNRVGISIGLGSAFYFSGTSGSLVHNTIALNENQNIDGQGQNIAGYLFSNNPLKVVNNIFAFHDIGIAADEGLSIEGSANVWWQNSQRPFTTDLFPGDTIHYFGDPLFVNPTADDYHIQRKSVAHSVGVSTQDALGYELLTDFEGRARSVPVDVGAYEHRYNRGLNLSSTVTPTVLNQNMTVQYMITVANDSLSSIGSISLQDVLPAQQQALAISSNRGSCNQATMACNLGGLNVGEKARVTVDALVTGAPAPAQLTKMTNRATVSFSGLDPNDSDTETLAETFLQDLVLDTSVVPTYTGACVVDLNGTVYQDVQSAVNASLRSSDVVKVSGYCGGTLNLAVDVTVQGGWSTNMKFHDPKLYTTTLDAAGSGTVLTIVGQGIEPKVQDMTLTGGNGPRGGGIYVSQASAVISNVVVVGNSSLSSGGGVFVDVFSVPKFFDSVIEGNTAALYGGGVYLTESGAKFQNVIVRNNMGAIDGGGYYIVKGAPEIAQGEISGHTVTGYGGGLFLNETSPQVREMAIQLNTAGVGGGIYAIKSPASIKFNRILTNTATQRPRFILIANVAPGGGGGIYAERSDIRILNNVIEYNSGGDGAGIHMWDFRQPEINGNVLALNNGNAVYLRQTPANFKLYILVPPVQPPPFGPELILPLPEGPPVRMRHNTFAENTGSAVQAFGRTNIGLVNNLIWNNGQGVVTEEEIFFHLIVIFYSIPFVPIPIPIPIPVPVFFPPTANVSYTYWGEGAPAVMPSSSPFATFNQDTDFSGENPAFTNPAVGDYHIKRISPAFQIGKNTDVSEDLDNTARNQGKRADIGADEYLFRQTRYASPTGGAENRCLNWKTPCSLQNAIDSAEKGDLIKLNAGNYTQITSRNGHNTVAYVDKEITLQGGYCSTAVASGLPLSGPNDCDWEHPKPTLYPSILGPGAAARSGHGRGLTIVGDVKPEVIDVQITGNSAIRGGGLYVMTATATLTRVHIHNNSATLGGGVFLDGAKPKIVESQITTNTATEGGGLYLLKADEALVISNTVAANTATAGGGFYVNASASKLFSNTVQANSAISGGGGFFLLDSEVKVHTNDVLSNTAGVGGGMFLSTGEPSVVSNTLTFNRAGDGGGFYLQGAQGTVDGNRINANVAISSGGGLYATLAKTSVKVNSIFSNTALSGGGVHLFAASDLIMQQNRIYWNAATQTGGGLALNASSSVLQGNVISANVAITGGGLHLTQFSGAQLKENLVVSNTATGPGGGVYLRLSNARFEETRLISNTAQSGGGLFAKLSAIGFKQGEASANSAATLGGGFYLDESISTIETSQVLTNTAGDSGGGLYILRSTGAKVQDGTIQANRSGTDGGGLSVSDSNITLKNLQVISNSAQNRGGGTYLNRSIVVMSRQLLSRNSATDGAGLFAANRSDGEYYANVFVDNVASNQAGALYAQGSSPVLYQTTIARNAGSEAVFIDVFGVNTSTLAFHNTIFADQPTAIRITDQNSATLEATLWHNVVSEWIGADVFTGTINLYENPRFALDGYHISKESPAVNQGVKSKAESDIDAQAIPQRQEPDIGADEYPVECAARVSSQSQLVLDNVQTAVDIAQPGDLIRLAGICAGVQTRNGKTQSVYLDKPVHIRGGYDPGNWDVSYPLTQPTTIDAEGKGRVIYITGDIRPTIESVILKAGNAVGQGGGPDGQSGGGNVYVDGSRAVFTGTIMTAGNADYGGGIFLLRSAAELITNTLNLNKAQNGGGVFLQESPAMLRDNHFKENGATADGGGLFFSASTATFERNMVEGNTAQTAGGGMFLDASSVTIQGNTFRKNQSSDSAGGAYLDASPSTLVGNRFEENKAENAGGVLIANAVATLDGNLFHKNNATNGGGLYLEQSNATVINNLVMSNTAKSAGDGIYILASSPTLLHNTVVFNQGGSGGAITVDGVGPVGSNVQFQNNIVANQATGMSVQPGNSVTADGNLWFQNSTADVDNLGSFTEGSTRIAADPRFADMDGFQLLFDSPAIDTALPSNVVKDRDGNPRPIDNGPDIGADEFSAPAMDLFTQVLPQPALAGFDATINFQAINLGNVALNAHVTATLPAVMQTGHPLNWPNILIPVGSSWNGVVTASVPSGYFGPLTYGLEVGTAQGISRQLTETAVAQLPAAAVTIQQTREPEQVLLGQPVRYNLQVSNVGNRELTLFVTDTLPIQAEPTGVISWSNIVIPTGGAWQQTITITPARADPPAFVNRIDIASSDGVSATHTDESVVGVPALQLSQAMQPAPLFMGEAPTLTVALTNVGTIAQQGTLSVTVQPDRFGGPFTKPGLVIPLSQTLLVSLPISPNSYLGPVTTTVALATDSGLNLLDTGKFQAAVRPLRPTITSTQDGLWTDPLSWTSPEGPRAPNETDIVLVAGHTLSLTAPVNLGSLWNKGSLVCPADGPLIINGTGNIQNFDTGRIICQTGADGAGPGEAGEAGQGIQLKAPVLFNAGQILAGDGGNGADGNAENPAGGAGGAGGAVALTVDFANNQGRIRGGNGGHGGHAVADGTPPTGPGASGGAGGLGGSATVNIQDPNGELTNSGEMFSGNGGNGGNGADGTPAGGGGGAGGSGGPLAIKTEGDGDDDDGVDIRNTGFIKSGDGGNGGDGGNNTGPGGDGGDGGGLEIDGDGDGDGKGGGANLENPSTIQGGAGGDGGRSGNGGTGGDGGKGGNLQATVDSVDNRGTMQSGPGGDGGPGPADGGDGGDLSVLGGQTGPGALKNTGTIQAGAGGNGVGPGRAAGGDGGDVTLTASPEIVLNGGTVAGGKDGAGADGGKNGMQGNVRIGGGDGNSADDPAVTLCGPNLTVSGNDIIIAGGQELVLRIKEMAPGSLNAAGNLILAVGDGGVIDLTGNGGLIFAAGQFLAFGELKGVADLGQLVNGTWLTSGPRTVFGVRVLVPQLILGRAGENVAVPIYVANLSPGPDSYQMQRTVSTEAGVPAQDLWQIEELPAVLPVAGSSLRQVPMTVTVPFTTAVGSTRLLAVRAASFSDPTEVHTGTTRILILPGGGLQPLYLPLLTNGRSPFQGTLYLPQVLRNLIRNVAGGLPEEIYLPWTKR